MYSRINSLSIKSLRGIKNLELKDFGDVNVILGDNNTGKTTILEAIRLFKKEDVNNIVGILKNRVPKSIPSINDFQYLFNSEDKKIEVSIDSSNGKRSIYMDYSLDEIVLNKQIFLSNDPIKKISNELFSLLIDKNNLEGKTMPQISGSFRTTERNETYSYIPLDFSYGNIDSKSTENKMNIVYESPYDHFSLNNSIISNIKRKESYYKIFIEVLKLFDNSINKVELLTRKNYVINFDEPEIYIQCGEKDPMPISTYGDGIKKVICISALIAQAVDGILLIDEIETSLHHSYYMDILYFLIKVAKKYNIQLFITTHSKEIVDVFAQYNQDNKLESGIHFYTLRKRNGKTNSRFLNDKEVEKYYNLGVEVRD